MQKTSTKWVFYFYSTFFVILTLYCGCVLYTRPWALMSSIACTKSWFAFGVLIVSEGNWFDSTLCIFGSAADKSAFLLYKRRGGICSRAAFKRRTAASTLKIDLSKTVLTQQSLANNFQQLGADRVLCCVCEVNELNWNTAHFYSSPSWWGKTITARAPQVQYFVWFETMQISRAARPKYSTDFKYRVA